MDRTLEFMLPFTKASCKGELKPMAYKLTESNPLIDILRSIQIKLIRLYINTPMSKDWSRKILVLWILKFQCMTKLKFQELFKKVAIKAYFASKWHLLKMEWKQWSELENRQISYCLNRYQVVSAFARCERSSSSKASTLLVKRKMR